MKKNLVAGAGFSGAVIARLLAENLNETVLVIDKKSHFLCIFLLYRSE